MFSKVAYTSIETRLDFPECPTNNPSFFFETGLDFLDRLLGQSNTLFCFPLSMFWDLKAPGGICTPDLLLTRQMLLALKDC